MSKFRKSSLIAVFFFFLELFISPTLALADNLGPAGLSDLEDLINRAIQLIVPVGFIALVIMLTWVGIKFLTSGGEPENLRKARSSATWAGVGVLFMVLAWLLLKLVAAFTGQDQILKFCITNFNGCP